MIFIQKKARENAPTWPLLRTAPVYRVISAKSNGTFLKKSVDTMSRLYTGVATLVLRICFEVSEAKRQDFVCNSKQNKASKDLHHKPKRGEGRFSLLLWLRGCGSKTLHAMTRQNVLKKDWHSDCQ